MASMILIAADAVAALGRKNAPFLYCSRMYSTITAGAGAAGRQQYKRARESARVRKEPPSTELFKRRLPCVRV